MPLLCEAWLSVWAGVVSDGRTWSLRAQELDNDRESWDSYGEPPVVDCELVQQNGSLLSRATA